MPKLYKRGRTWWADCTYYADGKRRRHQRSTGIRDDGTAQSKRTAAAHARNIESELAAGKSVRARSTTLRQAFAARLNEQELAGRAQATLEITAEKATNVLRFFGETKDAHEITDADLIEYATHARRKRASGTVFRELLELRASLKAAGITPPKMPKLGRSRPRERAFSAAESAALIAELPERWRDHATLYRLLGLSWSELYRITAADVDLPHGHVRVRGTKRETRDRTLPLPAAARPILERALERGPAQGPADLYPGALFELWKQTTGSFTMTAAAVRLGLIPKAPEGTKQERVAFNVLRASFCTDLVLKGVHPIKIARLMGHANTRMVERVYTRLRPAEHLADAMALLGLPEAAKRGTPAAVSGCNAFAADSTDTAGTKDATEQEKVD